MLEAIGGLTIVIGIGYFLLRNISNREDRQREDDLLIKYSETCQEMINEYNRRIESKTATWTNAEFRKKLNKIIGDPTERALAIKKIKDDKERADSLKERFINGMKENRKFAYAYEIAIFEIFDTKDKLREHVLVQEISNFYVVDSSEARRILAMWVDNKLVGRGLTNIGYYEIKEVLTDAQYKLVESDSTRDSWLKSQGKQIESFNK